MKPSEPTPAPPFALRIALTALVFLASLPVLPELERPVLGFVLFAFALRALSLYWPRLSPNRWLLMALTVGGVVNVLAAYFTVFGQAGVALLMTMSALKLLELKRNRDLRLGLILVLFIIVTDFLFDQSLSIAGYLLGVLVGAITVLAELQRGGDGARWRKSLRLAVWLSAQAVPLAALLFVLFPRLDAPLWQLDIGRRAAKTGMSDWLELGSVSRLVPSDEVAFRARFDGPAPDLAQAYWRGPVLWQTDGRRWEQWHDIEREKPPPLLGGADAVARYEITLEPTDQRWLFALELPVEIPGDAVLTGDFQILSDRPVQDRRRYRVDSATRYRMDALRPAERRHALQVPPTVTARMQDLVSTWKATSGSPEDLVRNALGYFRDQPFYYTLEPPTLGANPVDEFLFQTRRGFCEHFASGFALLMRLADVPSRIVLGYLGGERNRLGDYFVVRQSDAHAWTEVWLDGQGWKRIDPTAVIPRDRILRTASLDWLTREAPIRFRLSDAPGTVTALLRSLVQLTDSVNAAWHSWVLAYSSERQRQLLSRLGLGFIRDYGLVVAVVIAAGVFLVLLTFALQARPDRDQDPVQRLFARFCRRLARAGVARGRGEGPLDFARRAARLCPELAPAIGMVIEGYLPLRYGREPDERRLQVLRQGMRQLNRRWKARVRR